MLEVLALDYVHRTRQGFAGMARVHPARLSQCPDPFVTILGLEFGFLFSGVVVVETVFSWPGVGRLVFNSINQRDIPVVQAAVVLFSFMFVGLNSHGRPGLRTPRSPHPPELAHGRTYG